MDAETQANDGLETTGAGAPLVVARPRALRRGLALSVAVFACMALLVVAAGLLV